MLYWFGTIVAFIIFGVMFKLAYRAVRLGAAGEASRLAWPQPKRLGHYILGWKLELWTSLSQPRLMHLIACLALALAWPIWFYVGLPLLIMIGLPCLGVWLLLPAWNWVMNEKEKQNDDPS